MDERGNHSMAIFPGGLQSVDRPGLARANAPKTTTNDEVVRSLGICDSQSDVAAEIGGKIDSARRAPALAKRKLPRCARKKVFGGMRNDRRLSDFHCERTKRSAPEAIS
jgi:GMP synthase-like glutamine amidotransferase